MNFKNFRKNYRIADYAMFGLCTWIFIYCMLPWRFASHYDFLTEEDIFEVLVEQVTNNISLQQLPECDYSAIVGENAYTYLKHYQEKVLRNEEILPGGEYYPRDCKARFSVAIIVPYRQREEQLHIFLTYMHNYLRQQRIHYRIFLVEQNDQLPFNRAKLFNIGATIAVQNEFPCLILHDVDLLPLNSGNLYACTEKPRHMCSALDKFRFNLPYTSLFGGVVAIRSEVYNIINGMSNLYQGWGGEDDDFYERILAKQYSICRFEPKYSGYTMLRHKPETPNQNRGQLLTTSHLRFHIDGLNSLTFKENERRIHSLFTHILVEI
ncbi:beta-1,4-galactosyltransferase 1 [Teleopsis dalmanni]|uniref:beta-1,4-galactosyltransferase 1 n=1 Tax=Teleopsis dalmanni TaxID=139649 RepID=UPI0018CF9727|nr:beta-1,4-galactosyltransferase 1 [Teleopsis dalmanni]